MSLLERLLAAYSEAGGCNADYIAHLSTNHRCHKDILELPSKLFYGSSLYPMASAGTVPGSPYPLLFVCSSVTDPHLTKKDTSDDEAKLLVDQFRLFCQKGDSQSLKQDTCFMALSRRQVRRAFRLRGVLAVQVDYTTLRSEMIDGHCSRDVPACVVTIKF